MVIAICDSNNQSFAVKFDDDSVKEQVKTCMKEGLDVWYCAAHVPVDYEGSLFTKEEVEDFYDLGYAEPTEILLDRLGISYEIADIETDDDDFIINVDEVIDF